MNPGDNAWPKPDPIEGMWAIRVETDPGHPRPPEHPSSVGVTILLVGPLAGETGYRMFREYDMASLELRPWQMRGNGHIETYANVTTYLYHTKKEMEYDYRLKFS